MDFKLIDTHIHGSFGVNFNDASYEQIKYVLAKLFKKNIKGICPTLVGDSDINIQRQLSIFKKIRDEQLENCKNEALILGVHLEGTFLSPNKSGIQDKNVFKKPTVANFNALVGEFIDIIKIVTIAPEEDEGLIDYLIQKNIKVQAGHSIGDELKGSQGVTHIFNAMRQIHHREGSIALKGLIEDNIYCEIIADLKHCSKDILQLFFKVKPKNRVLLISDSLPLSNYDKEIIFCNKKIYSNGMDETGTLAGSNMTLDEICKNLVEQKILAKEDIPIMGFKNQVEYLNLSNREIDILKR